MTCSRHLCAVDSGTSTGKWGEFACRNPLPHTTAGRYPTEAPWTTFSSRSFLSVSLHTLLFSSFFPFLSCKEKVSFVSRGSWQISATSNPITLKSTGCNMCKAAGWAWKLFCVLSGPKKSMLKSEDTNRQARGRLTTFNKQTYLFLETFLCMFVP